MSTRVVFKKVVEWSNKYPVSRGMVSYALIWPIGSLVQQSFEGSQSYDYARVARFALFGSCFVAPTLNLWMKIASKIWPQLTIRAAISKALLEQITYGPFATSSFYFGMTLLEGNSMEMAKQEVRDKFLPTYKVAICVWPIIQTVNYTLVPVKNRVPFVSLASLIWTSFLAYMKHLERRVDTIGK